MDVLEQVMVDASGTAVQQAAMDAPIIALGLQLGVPAVLVVTVVAVVAEMLAPLVQDVVVGVSVVQGVQIIVLQLVIVDVHHLALLDVAIQLELGVYLDK